MASHQRKTSLQDLAASLLTSYPITLPVSHPCWSPAFLKLAPLASGPLHLRFPLSEHSCPQIFTWPLSPHLCLCCNPPWGGLLWPPHLRSHLSSWYTLMHTHFNGFTLPYTHALLHTHTHTHSFTTTHSPTKLLMHIHLLSHIHAYSHLHPHFYTLTHIHAVTNVFTYAHMLTLRYFHAHTYIHTVLIFLILFGFTFLNNPYYQLTFN